jgi:hypothetical protein
VALLLASREAYAQNREDDTLRLGKVLPGGIRASMRESWGLVEFEVTNRTQADRHALVVMFFQGKPDVQYGRDVWVPADSTIRSWMLVGPPGLPPSATGCEIVALLYEHSGRSDHLFLPTTERQLISRRVMYRPQEVATAIIRDEEDGLASAPLGQLPQPDSKAVEAERLAHTLRSAVNLPENLHIIGPGPLPVMPEALDGADQVVLASNRIARDPAGVQALRRWLQQGGRIWIMLDQIQPELVALLLGGTFDFQIADRISLTTTQIEEHVAGKFAPAPQVQQHDRPVDLVRVLLPAGERITHTVNGWPAWFARHVGRGKVVFTTLGPRGWYRPRTSTDRPSPYQRQPELPVPLPPLTDIAGELQPPAEEDPLTVESYRPLLAEDIGHAVIGRGIIMSVCAGFLLAALVLGAILYRTRRPELLGWLGPAAAVAASATVLVLNEIAHRAAPPTVAVVQLVEGGTGTEEAALHGLLASYRPDSGPADMGVKLGGRFDLDMTGVEEQTRRMLLTDLDAWHWDNLALPGGVRLAPFRCTAQAGQPLTAVARFGPEGIEGTITAGLFHDLSDGLLRTTDGRMLGIRVRADGTFSSGSRDALPPSRFVASAVLSDRQQRRQEVYRELLTDPRAGRFDGRLFLLAWADPLDMHFNLAPEARTVGDALLLVPLRLERPAAGASVTIPGPLISYRQILNTGPIRPRLEGSYPTDLHMRFQLPTVALPFIIGKARLRAKVDSPSRRVAIAGRAGEELVELHRVDSPLDPIRIDITEPRLLRLDEQGGLHLNLSISAELHGAATKDAREVDQKWKIEDLELEVVGKWNGER